MPGEVFLAGFAGGCSVLLYAVMRVRHRRKAVNEDEIKRHLGRTWLDSRDRKSLERRLAAMQSARPEPQAERPVAPQPRPQPTGAGVGGMEFKRRPGSGFYASCSIDGHQFDARWDHGADKCHISHDVAKAIGLNPKRLQWSEDEITRTADGRAHRVAIVKRDWQIGEFTFSDVDTRILEGGSMTLIGMSLISRLRTETDGDIFRIHPRKRS